MPDAATTFSFLGPEGTFTEQALLTLPEAADADRRPAASVIDALDEVRTGAVDAALVPFENSVEGSVPVTLDELAGGTPLVIVREVLLGVSFALMAREGTGLSSIRTVATHPHGEAQCRGWVRTELPNAEVHTVLSTAFAAAAVARGEFDAALAAPIAAQVHGLRILVPEVHDTDGAITRFVLVRRPIAPPAPTGADRTSMVLTTANDHVGALLEILTQFAVRGINLTRIESRPTKAKFGEYSFSIDCEGHIADPGVGEALAALHRICSGVRYLGSYPRAANAEPTDSHGAGADLARADVARAQTWLSGIRASGSS